MKVDQELQEDEADYLFHEFDFQQLKTSTDVDENENTNQLSKDHDNRAMQKRTKLKSPSRHQSHPSYRSYNQQWRRKQPFSTPAATTSASTTCIERHTHSASGLTRAKS
jgi:hypothetical protein